MRLSFLPVANFPTFVPMRLGIAILVACLGGFVLGCGSEGKRYDVRGVIESLRPEDRQVIISHEDVPGLMPAMTMNFDVEDPAILDGLEPGDAVHFELLFTGRAYIVREIEKAGEGHATEDWPELASKNDPAPTFALTDHRGMQVENASLMGKVVLIDFVYTHCPGPCPILTGVDVEARKALEDLEDRVVFCSITLDPERDDSAALAAYAKARGADFSNWHFLTGDAQTIHDLVRAFGVSSSQAEDGEIDHMVARFILDSEGRIAKRYLGMTHTATDIAGAIRSLVESSSGS